MASADTFRVTLQPSGHGYSAASDVSLLQAALDAGFALPYGCRNGACGSCKGKVLDGFVDHGTAQDSALSETERAAGMALLCCASARSDVTLECREVGAAKDIPIRILPCRVQQLKRVAEDVMILSLKLPTHERLQFLPGQYIEFLLKEGKRRAFSIANAPASSADEGCLQLHIRHVEGGEFTGHVFNTLKEKDILRFQGPYGSFFLREESNKPILLVAGGTGFAPIKAIVEHAIQTRCRRPIELYWGARNRAGIYLHELAAHWATELTTLRYVPVLSAPAANDSWTGRTGLVHEELMNDHPDLSGFQVYICGAPAMVDAARADFAKAGLPDDEYFADAFSFAGQ